MKTWTPTWRRVLEVETQYFDLIFCTCKVCFQRCKGIHMIPDSFFYLFSTYFSRYNARYPKKNLRRLTRRNKVVVIHSCSRSIDVDADSRNTCVYCLRRIIPALPHKNIAAPVHRFRGLMNCKLRHSYKIRWRCKCNHVYFFYNRYCIKILDTGKNLNRCII